MEQKESARLELKGRKLDPGNETLHWRWLHIPTMHHTYLLF